MKYLVLSFLLISTPYIFSQAKAELEKDRRLLILSSGKNIVPAKLEKEVKKFEKQFKNIGKSQYIDEDSLKNMLTKEIQKFEKQFKAIGQALSVDEDSLDIIFRTGKIQNFEKELNNLKKSAEDSLEIEIFSLSSKYEHDYRKHQELIKYQSIILATNTFLKDINFFNSLGFNIARYLNQIYVDYGYQNFKVLPLNQSINSGNKKDLKKTAQEYDVKFILNIYEIILSIETEKKAIIKAELFDAENNIFIFEKEFIGNHKNQGGYFACENGSVQCCISNASNKLFYLLLKTID